MLFEPPQVLVLVSQRVVRPATAFADPLGELNHLVNGLLTVQTHDVVNDHPANIVISLARQPGQSLDEHRNHDLGPSLPDQGDSAVEVEQDMADLGARLDWSRLLDAWPMRFQCNRLWWRIHRWPLELCQSTHLHIRLFLILRIRNVLA